MSWSSVVQRRCKVGFTLIELLLVVSIIAILAAIALPNYVKLKDKAKEAETKAALHNIQIVLERFAVDKEGIYPDYLIGGDNEWMEVTLDRDEEIRQVYIQTPAEMCSDPLLRMGYLDSYPRNPFIKQQLGVQQLQGEVGDPLRSAFEEGRNLGTRFGARGNVMGQALCDARWLTWTYNDLDNAKVLERNTWANVQYEFYDVWSGNLRRPHLPGEFMYKSIGEIIPHSQNLRSRASLTETKKEIAVNNKNKPDSATVPLASTSYMLAAWGGSRTKGMDLLGEEPLVIFTYRSRGESQMPYTELPYTPVFGGLLPGQPMLPSSSQRVDVYGIPPWTRGVNRSHVGPLWGSPYGPAEDSSEQLATGNPNGFADAIILWLSPGVQD